MSRFLFLFLLCAPAAHAGWDTHVIPSDSDFLPGWASIRYTSAPNFGIPNFQDAVSRLRVDGHIDRLEMIVLHGQVVDPQFQQEVIETLERHAPQEFAEAKDSAGNMHNPKLVALNKVFDETVLKTPTVEKPDANLGSVSRRVSGASHEKLTLIKNDGELTIMFFLYLSVDAI